MYKKRGTYSVHLPEWQAETSCEVIWIDLDKHGAEALCPFTHAKLQSVLQVMN